MRRGIIDKIKNKFSKSKIKLPEFIKLKIHDEKLKKFDIKILNFKKDKQIVEVLNKKLFLYTKIKEKKENYNIRIFDKKFYFRKINIRNYKISENVYVKNFDIEPSVSLIRKIKIENFFTNINQMKISHLQNYVKDIKSELNNVKIRDSISFIASIPKIYYSEKNISQEKVRIIGRKIKKKYTKISFKEYGIKHIFLNIPYKSFKTINYDKNNGSLTVLYKNEYKNSELINFVVLENAQTKVLKKIFI